MTASVSTPVKKRFLRYIYREAADATRADIVSAGVTADTAAARSAVIATETDSAIGDFTSGRALVGASANGKSTTYAQQAGLTAQHALELAEWAEDFIAEDTIADALALVPLPCRAFSIDFRKVTL